MKKHEYQQAFMQFGDPELCTDEHIQKDIFQKIQKFICEIYSVPGVLDVDAARLKLFVNNYSVNKDAASNYNITDDDENDLNGQYHDWMNDENSNDCVDNCDD
ncbi:unnamed protein product [Euphydryas editha]|uniref:Uncharacterized protein n=1 Tax=Euphydryas editha TaxID=104508 RepID=A0AAU9TWV3_EUPED|nr:unnamed protein product [Euphydryas editha]